jgi:uncharacterized caspase-like protein
MNTFTSICIQTFLLFVLTTNLFSQKIDTLFLNEKTQHLIVNSDKKGVYNGKYLIYNEYDELIEEGEYKNGKKNGKSFIYNYYYDGIECFDCANENEYNDLKNYSHVIRQTVSYKNGILEGETWYQLGSYNFSDKFKTEHDICYGIYKNGLRDGQWSVHNIINEKASYGEKIIDINFNNDKIIEPVIINRETNFNGLVLPFPSFLDNVKIKERYANKVYGNGYFEMGVKINKWEYFTSGGDKKKETNYDHNGKIINEKLFQTTNIVINDMKIENIKFLDVDSDSTQLLLAGKGKYGELKFWIYNIRDKLLLKSGKISAEYASGVNFYNGDTKYLCIYSYMSGISSILDIETMEIIETRTESCEKFYDISYTIKDDLKKYFNFESISKINIKEPDWTEYKEINAFLFSVLIKNEYSNSTFISNIDLKTGTINFENTASNKESKLIYEKSIKYRDSLFTQKLLDSLKEISISNISFNFLEYNYEKNGKSIFNYEEFKETEFDFFDQFTLLSSGKESKYINFAYDNKVCFSDYREGNGYIVLWNGNYPDKNKRAVRLNIKRDKSFIFYSPDLYYMFKGNLTSDLFFEQDLKLFPFEQFDLKYNRPDIILERLGYSDPNTIASYNSAYKKRLKKMNFTEDMLKSDFHLPELKLKNLSYLPIVTENAEINLDLEIIDSKYKLDRINIYINDVPIYGTTGIDLRNESQLETEIRLNIQLTEGENKIQVSVLNQAGAESYKETAYVTYKPKKSIQPDLYLVTIGDSKYSDSRYDLTYASKDATDIKNTFEKNSNSLYGTVHAFIYTDTQVTKENILKLKSELLKAKRDDVVIITVAGHGVLDKNLDYYLATYDMDFSNPSNRGLPYEELESLLDGIAPLKKVLFLDACHSGEIDKEEVEQLATNTVVNSKVKYRDAGTGIQKKNLGLKSTSELMGELFTDLRRGTGATVISSAGGVESAMESDEWKNGLFTYCLLHGLKDKVADENGDGKIMLSELQNYLRKEVTELSNGAQQPTSRIENLSMDFRVW